MNTAYLLMTISKQLKHALNQVLLEKGITIQQWAVIQQLSAQEQLTAAALADILDIDRPTLSGIVKRLENKELLVRQKNPEDSRSYLLTLTQLGREQVSDYQKLSDQLLTTYLAPLTVAEQRLLNDLLTKLEH